MKDASPLEQRQSSRSARRAARSNATEETASMSPSNEAPPTTPRGPSTETERRIAESIEKRKASNVAAAANEEIYKEEESEILGTYEYRDHTADIQIHAYGGSFVEALEQLALAMFGYMTKVSLVEIDDTDSQNYGSEIRVEAHDLESLVFAFLQEWLCIFHENHFIPRKVSIELVDLENFVVVSSGQGETMKPIKHTQGTEVKAVTYSNLQVITNEDEGCSDIWVILDI